VFARDAEDKWIQQAKLKYSDDGYDSFGNSVAIYKNTIVVGAWGSDNAEEDITNSGATHIWDVLVGTWVREANLMDDIGKMEDNFGNMVASYKYTIIINAQGDDGEGSNEGQGISNCLPHQHPQTNEHIRSCSQQPLCHHARPHCTQSNHFHLPPAQSASMYASIDIGSC